MTNVRSTSLRLVFPGRRKESGPQSFDITGRRETLKEASLLFTIHLMHLTTQDQHELQLDPIKVPSPHFKVVHLSAASRVLNFVRSTFVLPFLRRG